MTARTITNSRLVDGAKLDNLPADVNASLATKVDKVTWKGLSTNDYTDTEKTKLAGIEAGAQVNQVNEAPSDGKTYGRKNAAWAEVTSGSGGGHVIQDEGVSLAQRSKLNFVGAGVTATDDSVNDATVITIPTVDVSGLVTWPSSATDNAIARFDTTTGKLIQNSVVTVGDTGNVSGINDILSANSVGLSLTPASVPATVGTTYWNAAENCMETPYSADVSLSHGLEMYVRVVNKTGATVTDGTTVYVDGAQGNRPTIQKAKADALTTTRVIGVATQDIANNAEGFVTVFGNVHRYNTSGFTAWDPLYVSATTAGALTNVAPSSPNYVVFVGRALNSTVNGLIHVNPRAPIDADVNLGSDPVAATEGAVKSYVDTAVSSKVPTSRTLTINGVAYDLSADRSWTIATGWTKQIRIRIPGELVADTSNYQWVFWYNDTGASVTISNVGFFVGLAAQGTGAAAAFNVYKSSGTSTDGINTSATNLFTSAVDLGTAYSSATNVPNTATVEAWRWISLRVTSSAGATRKASDAEVVITYS